MPCLTSPLATSALQLARKAYFESGAGVLVEGISVETAERKQKGSAIELRKMRKALLLEP